MAHIFFIDPLEKLSPKKDSSLMLAATMKEMGIEVKILFEKDFYVTNTTKLEFSLYDFKAQFKPDGAYLESFEIAHPKSHILNENDILHMRIDPPFDTRYLRYLWMLRFIQGKGVAVINSPDGILKYNEKLHAYAQKSALPSYVGSSESGFGNFITTLGSNEEIILKPLDLYQGMGVEKISLINKVEAINRFKEKVIENNGPIVAQTYCAEVTKGEIRSLYFKGKELGSILKVPKAGEFLANIAQGAGFHAIELSSKLQQECNDICKDLMTDGVDWVAFDILNDHVSEINITCPGLLVEVSYAHKKNFARIIGEYLI
jgi:glutathione synthase